MILFDFDGVLIDSVDEVIVSSYYAITGNFVSSLDALPPLYTELFRANRFQIQSADDLIVLGRWCLTHSSPPKERLITRTLFKELLDSASISRSERRSLLFSHRARIIERTPDAWLALNRPFQPLWSALQKAPDKVLIITNKNLDATLTLTRAYNLPLASSQIFSGDAGATKASHFESIKNQYQNREFLFIDDSIHNLTEMKRELSVRSPLSLGLALWGYIGESDPTIAQREGFLTLTQENAVEEFHRRIDSGK